MSRALAALGAAILLLAGCGEDGRPSDGERLESYAGLLEAQLFTYEAGVAAGYPEAEAGIDAVRRRVEAVRAAVEAQDRTPPSPPETVAEVEDVLPGLAGVESRAEFVRFAGELESAVSAARPAAAPAIP